MKRATLGHKGGSDEKMRRMWLGREIDVAGLPPLAEIYSLYQDSACQLCQNQGIGSVFQSKPFLNLKPAHFS